MEALPMAKETAAEKAAAAEAADGEKAVFRVDMGESLPPQKPFATATDATDKAAPASKTARTAKTARTRTPSAADADVDATDAARDLADEEDVDITTVKGTGAEGRITVGDVQAAIDKRDAK